MSARKKSLNASVYTLDGNNHLADFLMQDFGVDISTEDAKGGAVAYEKHVATKRKSTHAFQLLHKEAGAALGALDVTVLNLDGDILGDFQSFNWQVQNKTQDGSGGADFDEFPNAVGSAFGIRSTRFIPASAVAIAELVDLLSADPDDQAVTALMTYGAYAFSCPARLTSGSHRVERDKLDVFNLGLKSTAAPTITVTGGGSSDIISVAVEGDGLISVASTVGVYAYSGTGVITSMSADVQDRQLIKINGQIDLQGKWSLA